MYFPHRNFFQIFIIFIIILYSANSFSSVIINGTRVIYPSSEKEVTVKIDNKGASPVLVQSWLDTGDANAKPAAIKVPFILTPPMNRIEGGKGQTLRISYTGSIALPKDKESVFWLNVLEIPVEMQSKTGENYLQMAFRSRIKLFYRPAGLEGNPNDAAKSVIWVAKGNSLHAENPTPYYVSFVNLTVNGKQVEGEMIAPRSSLVFKLPANTGNKVNGKFVNDYGGVVSFESEIK